MLNDKVREQRSDWLTNFCRTIGFITSFCALLCMMAFATSLFHEVSEENQNLNHTEAVIPWEKTAHAASERILRIAGRFSLSLRSAQYCTLFGYHRDLTKLSGVNPPAAEIFVEARGTFQIVIAALTQHAAHADGTSDLAKWVPLFPSLSLKQSNRRLLLLACSCRNAHETKRSRTYVGFSR
eukprot:282028-Prorocentrum_minimum.AAC.2